jgi:hypothetical protein
MWHVDALEVLKGLALFQHGRAKRLAFAKPRKNHYSDQQDNKRLQQWSLITLRFHEDMWRIMAR